MQNQASAEAIANEIKKRIAEINKLREEYCARLKDIEEREKRNDYREENLSRREKIIFGKIQK